MYVLVNFSRSNPLFFYLKYFIVSDSFCLGSFVLSTLIHMLQDFLIILFFKISALSKVRFNINIIIVFSWE